MSKRNVTFKGEPVFLLGRSIKEKAHMPNCTVLTADMEQMTLRDVKKKIKIITSFVSVDTPVCYGQLEKFSEIAKKISNDVEIIGVSNDLPFALARAQKDNSFANLTLCSDYLFNSFGVNYGLLVKKMHVLARSVLILDEQDILRYLQLVPEMTDAPNYADVVENLEMIINKPQLEAEGATMSECKPCKGEGAALAKEAIESKARSLSEWKLMDDTRLERKYSFSASRDAIDFLRVITVIAEEQGHHPELEWMYNNVRVSLSTHAVKGLTDNDFTMAQIIDDIY